jgi:hypothetical protein
VTFVSVALLSGIAGWFLSRMSLDADVERLEAEVAAGARERGELESRLARYEAGGAEEPAGAEFVSPRDLGVLEPRDAPASPGVASGDEEAADPLAAPGPRQRTVRTAELRAQFDGWFEKGEGEKALEALKELAKLVPEGREAAMELAVRINDDVQGEGNLNLSQMVFYTNLGSPEIVGLFNWSLENDSPASFRQMAVYSLPWTAPQEEVLGRFTELLREETDSGVQRALVWNLAQMRKPEAERALAGLLHDSSRDAVVRTQALTELAMSDEPEVVRTIEEMAYRDPDPTVRNAAKAALQMRDPPASGFMVTGTLPESQAEAAGMQAGDIIVSYDGRSTRSLEDLRRAAGDATAKGDVEVVVVRDGRRVPLRLRPGQMGVFGREVEEK